MFSAVLVALLLLLAAFSPAISQNPPTCRGVTPLPNAETTKMSGLWYIIEYRFYNVDRPVFKCLVVDYHVDNNGVFTNAYNYTVAATNQAFIINAVGTPTEGVRSVLSLVSTITPGNAEISVIMNTDYDNYAIVVTCLAPDKYYILVIAKGKKTLSQTLLRNIKRQLVEAGFIQDMVLMDQENC